MYDYAIEIVNSKRDKSANVYYYINVTNLRNDKKLSANCHAPNLSPKLSIDMGLKIYWTSKELPVKTFDNFYPAEYAGNNFEDIIKYIIEKTK